MCWKCGSAIQLTVISRSSECPECHTDLHSCRNCEYYEPGSHYDCHETVEESVSDKERANFCDSFKVKRDWEFVSSKKSKAQDAKAAFDALFS
ncbi:MAG: hypothetical protein J5930_06405 [Treponema sp.]|nr:hypothetical protein [Treponema sp.]MBO5607512.1 hypothetical protein [Treponema sp.]HAK69718.1 hypothetical protein [Treponema sp.]